MCTDEPPRTAMRLPIVPMPRGKRAVSAEITLTSLDRHVEDVGGDLREDGRLALALRGRAGGDHRPCRSARPRPARPRTGRGRCPRRSWRCRGRDSLPCARAPSLARREIARRAPSAVSRQRVIVAAVVGHRRAVARLGAGRVGELVLAHEAAAAHLGAVELQFARDAVGEPLQHERGVRPAGAAHRRGRHLVGEDDVERDVDRLERIGPGQRAERRERQDQPVGQIGAVVVQAAAAHAEHAAVVVGRDLEVPDLVALLRGGEEMLAPVLDPFDRAAAACIAASAIASSSGIDAGLRPEPAADLRRDHAHAAFVAADEAAQACGAPCRAPGSSSTARAGARSDLRRRSRRGIPSSGSRRDAGRCARENTCAARREHLVDVAELRAQGGGAIVGRALRARAARRRRARWRDRRPASSGS